MNYYLHRHSNYSITTTKNKIIFDLDKMNHNQQFISNILKKYPQILEIIGNKYDTFQPNAFCYDFPVEKVIVNKEYLSGSISHLLNFYKTIELEFTNITKEIHIINNLGLNKINNIIIPFTINEFSNKYINDNQIKTLTIYNDKDKLTLDLDKCLLDKKISIKALNNDNKLNINITSNNIDIEYNIYLKENKLVYDKKYNQYEIDASDDNREELNIIELKKLYNEIFFKGRFYYVEKIILNKNDINYLNNDLLNYSLLEEIKINDNNQMSLIPRYVNIKVDINKYEQFNEIEVLNNNLLISINIDSITPKKYIIVNKYLNIININKYIDTIILDYNANNFKYENNILTIPFNKEINRISQSNILNEIIKKSNKITVRKNNKEYNIKTKELSDIIYNNSYSFNVEYLRDILGEFGDSYYNIIYDYDISKNKIKYSYQGKIYKEELIKIKKPRKR